MSLYREARSGWAGTAAAAALALAVGLGGGVAIGRATADHPTLAQSVRGVQADVRDALDALEVLTVEYPQAVADGRVRAETEYRGAQTDVERARSTVARVHESLALLDPRAARRADATLARLRQAVDARRDPAEVERLAHAAQTSLRAAARL